MDPKASSSNDAEGQHAGDYELITLRALSGRFPDVDSAMAEIARLAAVLTLPKGTVHVISDIHGEDKKLRHVINNASGTLRPLVQKLFAERMSPGGVPGVPDPDLLPGEVVERLEHTLLDPEQLRSFCTRTLRHEFELVRVLAARYSLRRAMEVFPPEYRDLMAEMLHEPTTERDKAFVEAIVDELLRRGRVLHLIHVTARLVRNLAIYELIIGGDCWDRGPRGDRVVDYLRQQPNVSFIWGNHDAAWLGACLGHEALICHVLRVSLRYRRLGQLDEGLQHPPHAAGAPGPHGLRRRPRGHASCPGPAACAPDLIVARMQKAAAIMQFKLEGQVIARNPQWELEHRRLLHRIDHAAGTIEVDGSPLPAARHAPADRRPGRPLRAVGRGASAAWTACDARSWPARSSGEHMRYLVSHGSMYLVRDGCLIFHGCVPVDAAGEFLTLSVDGQPLRRPRPVRRDRQGRAARGRERQGREGPRPALVPLERRRVAALRQGPDHHPRDATSSPTRPPTTRPRTRTSS